MKKGTAPADGGGCSLDCGAWENRTPDILLAKQALYQLS